MDLNFLGSKCAALKLIELGSVLLKENVESRISALINFEVFNAASMPIENHSFIG